MRSSDKRVAAFQRNEALEELLAELAADLGPAEERLADKYADSDWAHPIVLVMGPLRSGTTLFTQWLASSGLYAYPTNLLSRFYAAPILGAKIQRLLTDPRYRYRDELDDIGSAPDFESENGKTRGALAPNEFWYFWRRFLPDPSRDVWSDRELRDGVDDRRLRSEIAGLLDVFGKPFVAKGMLFNYNIRYLDAVLDKVVFVQLQRDLVANVASVLDARERQHGSREQWYSFRIPEYGQLGDLDAVSQAAGQVVFTQSAIDRGLDAVDPDRRLKVRYEDFCNDPRSVFEALADKTGLAKADYTGPKRFQPTRTSIAEASAIEEALKRFL